MRFTFLLFSILILTIADTDSALNAQSIVSQPQDTITICFKDSDTIRVSSLSAADKFQWQKNSSGFWVDLKTNSVFQGVNDPDLRLVSVSDSLNGWMFRCIVDSQGLGVRDTSDTCALTVYHPITRPYIFPLSDSICFKGSLKLTINTLAFGGNDSFNYIWQRDSVGIWIDVSKWSPVKFAKGFNTLSLKWHKKYRVRAISRIGCGNTVSDTSNVHVYRPFDPGKIGGIDTLCFDSIGSVLNFLASSPPSGGDSVYSYQWSYSSNPNFATSDSTLSDTLKNYTPGKLGASRYLRVRVTSGHGCGTTYTDSFYYKVWDSLEAAIIGSTQTICFDSIPDTLVVKKPATGGGMAVGNIIYEWQDSLAIGRDWRGIPITNNDSLGLGNLQATRFFRLKTSSTVGCGSVFSDLIPIRVHRKMFPGTISGDDTICFDTIPGRIMKFHSYPTGGGGFFKFQWLQSYNDTNYSPTDISDTLDSMVYNKRLKKSIHFRLQVTSSCSIDTTDIVYIHVLDSLRRPKLSLDQSICYDSIPAELSVTAEATGADGNFKYEWQVLDGGKWRVDARGKNKQLKLPALRSSSQYRVRTSSDFGCSGIVSDTISINVFDRFVGDSIYIIGSDTVCFNVRPDLFALAKSATGGNTPYARQWYESDDGNGWNLISGATGSSYQAPQLKLDKYYQLRTTSASGCGIRSSNVLFIEVLQKLERPIIGDSQTICYLTIPEELQIDVLPRGGYERFSYHWEFDNGTGWVSMKDSTRREFQPGQLDKTTYFKMVAEDDCGLLHSDSIKITVHPKLTASLLPLRQDICYSRDALLVWDIAPEGGGNDYSYQWLDSLDHSDFKPIDGANGPTLSITDLTTDIHVKQVITSNLECGSVTSNASLLNSLEPFRAGKVIHKGAKDTICFDSQPDSFIMNTRNTGGKRPYKFWWIRRALGNDLWDSITVLNDSTFQSGSIKIPYEYALVTSSDLDCKTDTTNTITINLYPLPDSATINGLDTVCGNQSDVYYEIEDPQDLIEYKWTVNWGDLLYGTFLDHCYVRWDILSGTRLLQLRQVNTNTGCAREVTLPVVVTSDKAPSKTRIKRKEGSNMLVCEDKSEGLTYQWGYIEKATGIDRPMASSNRRYFLYQDAIDTTKHIYYVRTGLGSCETVSYFNDSPIPAFIQPYSEEKLSIYPNPSKGFFWILGFNEGMDVKVYDINGRDISLSAENGFFEVDEGHTGMVLVRIIDDKGGVSVNRLVIVR